MWNDIGWYAATEDDEVQNNIGWCTTTKDDEVWNDIGWCTTTKDDEVWNDKGWGICPTYFYGKEIFTNEIQ